MIKGVFGTDEFITWRSPMDNSPPCSRPRSKLRPADVRTLHDLIMHYKANNQQFKANRDGTTKKGYNSRHAQIDRDDGDCPVSTFDRATIRSFLEAFDDLPGAGLDTHKKFKNLNLGHYASFEPRMFCAGLFAALRLMSGLDRTPD